jgi:hypothetical protein
MIGLYEHFYEDKVFSADFGPTSLRRNSKT